MYRQRIYPFLARLDAERAHELVLRLLAAGAYVPPLLRLVRRGLAVDDRRLQVELWGLRFANPLGVAAGLDKNGVALSSWGALGFGHVEVGTVTPQPQPGNLRPRVFRLTDDQALINRMGFPGQGATAVGRRLAQPGALRPIVGVNIGANKASVEAGRAADDYGRALAQLAPVADYLTINISSPNTARLRDLQGAAALRALVEQIVLRRNLMLTRRPLLIKIAPDLTPAELDAILAICLEYEIDGIVATNTTIARPTTLRGQARAESGGLSGAPLRDRATELIGAIQQGTAGKLPVIGVGGVFSGADVLEKLAAGARLVQVYTGLVYEGPLLARRINRELVRLMDHHGCASLAELVRLAAQQPDLARAGWGGGGQR